MKKLILLLSIPFVLIAQSTVNYGTATGTVSSLTPTQLTTLGKVPTKADKTALSEVNATVNKKIDKPIGEIEGKVLAVGARGNDVEWITPTSDVNLSEYSKTLDINTSLTKLGDKDVRLIDYKKDVLSLILNDNSLISTTLVIPEANLSAYRKAIDIDTNLITLKDYVNAKDASLYNKEVKLLEYKKDVLSVVLNDDTNVSTPLVIPEANLTAYRKSTVIDANLTTLKDNLTKKDVKELVFKDDVLTAVFNDDTNTTVDIQDKRLRVEPIDTLTTLKSLTAKDFTIVRVNENSGEYVFRLGDTSTELTDRIIADNAGLGRWHRVTTSTPVKYYEFAVYDNVVGNKQVVQYKPNAKFYDSGDNFDLTTGEFIAPVKGVYFFNWTVFSNELSTLLRAGIYVNGNLRHLLGQHNGAVPDSDKNSKLSVDLLLNSGDRVSIKAPSTFTLRYYGGENHNVFTGRLVTPFANEVIILQPTDMQIDKTGLADGDTLAYDQANDKMVKGDNLDTASRALLRSVKVPHLFTPLYFTSYGVSPTMMRTTVSPVDGKIYQVKDGITVLTLATDPSVNTLEWELVGGVVDTINTYTKAQRGGYLSTPASIDFDLSNNYTIQLSGDLLIPNPTNIPTTSSQGGIIKMSQDAVSGRVVTWDTNWKLIGVCIEDTSTLKTNVYQYTTVDSSTVFYQCVGSY